MAERTYTGTEVEEAIQDVIDRQIATTERVVEIGYDDGEISPLDIAGRVLDHLIRKKD